MSARARPGPGCSATAQQLLNSCSTAAQELLIGWGARGRCSAAQRATHSRSSVPHSTDTGPPSLVLLASPHIDSAFELKTRIKIFRIKNYILSTT